MLNTFIRIIGKWSTYIMDFFSLLLKKFLKIFQNK